MTDQESVLMLEAWAEEQGDEKDPAYNVRRLKNGSVVVSIHTGIGAENTFWLGYGYAPTIAEAFEKAKKDFKFVPKEDLGLDAEVCL